MQQPPPAHRNLRLAAAAGALVALLGLVAFATRSGFGGHASNAAPSHGFADWAFSGFLVLFVTAIPLTFYLYLSAGGGAFVRRRRRGFRERVLQQLATVAVVLLAVAVVAYLRHHHPGGFRLNLSALRGAAGNGAHGQAGASRHSPAFKWPVAVAGGALWAVLVVAWYTSRRRLPHSIRTPAGLDEGLAADVAGTIGDAIDDLEAEPDARRAVIAAYARMEGVLARHGLRRTVSETPLEYLRRALLGLTVHGDAVQALTRLFEEARFSRHEIDATMKQDAIGALRTIRDDLQGAAA